MDSRWGRPPPIPRPLKKPPPAIPSLPNRSLPRRLPGHQGFPILPRPHPPGLQFLLHPPRPRHPPPCRRRSRQRQQRHRQRTPTRRLFCPEHLRRYPPRQTGYWPNRPSRGSQGNFLNRRRGIPPVPSVGKEQSDPLPARRPPGMRPRLRRPRRSGLPFRRRRLSPLPTAFASPRHPCLGHSTQRWAAWKLRSGEPILQPLLRSLLPASLPAPPGCHWAISNLPRGRQNQPPAPIPVPDGCSAPHPFPVCCAKTRPSGRPNGSNRTTLEESRPRPQWWPIPGLPPRPVPLFHRPSSPEQQPTPWCSPRRGTFPDKGKVPLYRGPSAPRHSPRQRVFCPSGKGRLSPPPDGTPKGYSRYRGSMPTHPPSRLPNSQRADLPTHPGGRPSKTRSLSRPTRRPPLRQSGYPVAKPLRFRQVPPP